MKYCTKCVQPDTRPGILFNEKGVCPPCQYMEKAESIDWEERKKELNNIILKFKIFNKSGYDCIIGVSGGKDSNRQAMYVKNVLGLKPLLVSCVYPPEQQTERGAQNLGNLIALGFDAISVSPAPQIWKKLMRQSFLKYGNWAKSTEMALYACLPRIATAYHIPLIFLGENPAIQVGALGVGSFNWDANKMKEADTIASGPEDLISENMDMQDIIWYKYPPTEEMLRAHIQIVYLGYFWDNFTKVDNANFSIANGLEIRTDTPKNMGTIHSFEALDEDFVLMNQMMKHLKLGFGKITDDVSEQVRFGRMTRKEAARLVKLYDGKCSDRYITTFCDYTGLSKEKFWEVAESFRNKNIWEKSKNNKWKIKTPIQ